MWSWSGTSGHWSSLGGGDGVGPGRCVVTGTDTDGVGSESFVVDGRVTGGGDDCGNF